MENETGPARAITVGNCSDVIDVTYRVSRKSRHQRLKINEYHSGTTGGTLFEYRVAISRSITVAFSPAKMAGGGERTRRRVSGVTRTRKKGRRLNTPVSRCFSTRRKNAFQLSASTSADAHVRWQFWLNHGHVGKFAPVTHPKSQPRCCNSISNDSLSRSVKNLRSGRLQKISERARPNWRK